MLLCGLCQILSQPCLTNPCCIADAGTAARPAIDPVLRHLLANARSEAVLEQFMQTPAEEYASHQGIKILTASYNVNGRSVPSGTDLREWLAVGGSHGEPHIVAVGFQELVPLNASNVVMGKSCSALHEPIRLHCILYTGILTIVLMVSKQYNRQANVQAAMPPVPHSSVSATACPENSMILLAAYGLAHPLTQK